MTFRGETVENVMACLKALTPEARTALGAPVLALGRFPFRVGRESRNLGNGGASDSRRRDDSTPTNDLYLQEKATDLNISREHFLIDLREGGFVIEDLGSSCGTIVDGEMLGGKRRGERRVLVDHDVIIVGTSASRFVFQFVVARP